LRVAALCLAGALVVFLGPLLPLPPGLPLEPVHLWAAAGVAVAVLGLVLGRLLR
jgi:hypothetical protein